ncbi:hypothetical protein KZZ52_47330 [Dactylosporangium sp. AC04546]|uniref:hypothetical protein n=1 Tax=Dactylosporangium sp. AC04546 TaxID=2862460 RepID=UPI001EE0E1BB|nr:hypothetical protein [Dactylosporangium sp. AC04546]WVK81527.1 hypothetical protein KZZ52_47330 [Dactylosporangium sp. AC04546]
MDDPHIHVEAGIPRAGATVRNLVAATFGLVGQLPAEVATGCGRRVPTAMTSGRPESVTCLACREHAHRQHLLLADQVEAMSRMAGPAVTPGQGAEAAARLREIAARFAS